MWACVFMFTDGDTWVKREECFVTGYVVPEMSVLRSVFSDR